MAASTAFRHQQPSFRSICHRMLLPAIVTLLMAVNSNSAMMGVANVRQWPWHSEQLQQQAQRELLGRELLAEAIRQRQLRPQQWLARYALQAEQQHPMEYYPVNVPVELPPIVVADEPEAAPDDYNLGENMIVAGGQAGGAAAKAKRAQPFVRLGKRAQTFVRFGKRAQMFVRFGRANRMEQHQNQPEQSGGSGSNNANAN